MDVQLPIEARNIQKLIPYRYPLLQLDCIIVFEPMETLTATKNVIMNEPQFQGHLLDLFVMSSVLIIEATARVYGTLAVLSGGGRRENELFFSTGIDDTRFKHQVIPGGQLAFEVEPLANKRGIGKFNVVAKVNSQVAVEAVAMYAERVV